MNEFSQPASSGRHTDYSLKKSTKKTLPPFSFLNCNFHVCILQLRFEGRIFRYKRGSFGSFWANLVTPLK